MQNKENRRRYSERLQAGECHAGLYRRSTRGRDLHQGAESSTFRKPKRPRTLAIENQKASVQRAWEATFREIFSK